MHKIVHRVRLQPDADADERLDSLIDGRERRGGLERIEPVVRGGVRIFLTLSQPAGVLGGLRRGALSRESALVTHAAPHRCDEQREHECGSPSETAPAGEDTTGAVWACRVEEPSAKKISDKRKREGMANLSWVKRRHADAACLERTRIRVRTAARARCGTLQVQLRRSGALGWAVADAEPPLPASHQTDGKQLPQPRVRPLGEPPSHTGRKRRGRRA